jgi:hypothetical protein
MTVETDMFGQERRSNCVRTGPEATAVDAWVRQSLGDRFDNTLAEALPGEMAALVAQFEN